MTRPLLGAACAALLLGLGACDDLPPSRSLQPQARPAAATVPTAPSTASQDLVRYYAAVQRNQLAQGLMRTGGGGPDTPFTADDLVRDFINIAFFTEYGRGSVLSVRGSPDPGQLNRWNGPVRIGTEFGPSVPAERRDKDRAVINAYAGRLARVTGHDIAPVSGGANFHVFVVSSDDKEFFLNRLRQLKLRLSDADLRHLGSLDRSTYCLVVTFANALSPNLHTRAITMIRAEQPDLMRLACVHEEIAQGLGLPNDSPYARPSIFNDDDEFALLTTHDEMLLRMLYDPRLKPGMSAERATPVARIIARELMGATL